MDPLPKTWWLAAIAKALFLGLLLTGMSLIHADPGAEIWQRSVPDALQHVLFGTIFIPFPFALAGLWSWRRLEPIRVTLDGRWVVDRGVGWGMVVVGLTVLYQAERASSASGLLKLVDQDFWITAAWGLVVGAPFALWGGRLFGYLNDLPATKDRG